MKTELGLDERDPSCFLHTYSVVMVLRKVRAAQDSPPCPSLTPGSCCEGWESVGRGLS